MWLIYRKPTGELEMINAVFGTCALRLSPSKNKIYALLADGTRVEVSIPMEWQGEIEETLRTALPAGLSIDLTTSPSVAPFQRYHDLWTKILSDWMKGSSEGTEAAEKKETEEAGAVAESEGGVGVAERDEELEKLHRLLENLKDELGDLRKQKEDEEQATQ